MGRTRMSDIDDFISDIGRNSWAWSLDGKEWSDPLPSRYMALMEARKKTDGTVYVGRTYDPDVMQEEIVDAALNDQTMELFEEWIEELMIDAGAPRDSVVGSPFKDPIGAKEWEELRGDLASTMTRWALRHNLRPNWISVVDVEEVSSEDLLQRVQ